MLCPYLRREGVLQVSLLTVLPISFLQGLPQNVLPALKTGQALSSFSWALTQGTSSLNTALVILPSAARHWTALLRTSFKFTRCKTGEVGVSAVSQKYQTAISFLTTFLSSSTYSALLLAAVSFPCWEELNLKNKRGTGKDPGWDLRNAQTWEWYCHVMNKTKMEW